MKELKLVIEDVAMNCLVTVLSKMFLNPHGDILYRVMSGFHAVLLEESKVTGIQCCFFSLPLSCRDLVQVEM